MFAHLIHIETTQYSMSGAQLCDELVRVPQSAHCHQLTYINVSYDSYLLAPGTRKKSDVSRYYCGCAVTIHIHMQQSQF
jgi:hypothetical protein